jgi:single-strand selective monofunctional uracil DNA glycosylase
MEESARNRTPDKLPVRERIVLFEACDRALVDAVRQLGASHVLGVGAFAAGRIAHALGDSVSSGQVPHPSPANPAANRGWARLMDEALARLHIAVP